MRKLKSFLLAGAGLCSGTLAVGQHVQLVSHPDAHKVDVLVGGKPFTTYLYPDTLEKPVLYPLRTADGQIVTRGFPLDPRSGEPTDHPHHLGMWLNYESVNGLDFWNNSYAIPAEKKSHYGWIRPQRILEARSGKKGVLKVTAEWQQQDRTVLLNEQTTYVFSGDEHRRTIDRITTLTAVRPVTFADVKDGMLGIRVARELQLPEKKPQQFADNSGNVTTVAADKDDVASGDYLTSEGKTGDDAWATRGRWCMLFGKKGGETVSIVIFDHPGNPGYPTYWHARGYGLFAANPLGQKVFSKGKEALNLQLQPGQSVTFRYRVLITDGDAPPTAAQLNKMADVFAKASD
ncbi:PmoA family protein [Compostibacter hankyongensis]|uniref:Methane oxygenase PmoA n=1 Tax=Compostibacter hankyongensis TaxID=1007089 RepID=A0ABP8FIU7_9BACT